MCAQKKYSICRVWFSGFRHPFGLLEHIPVEKGAGNDCTDATEASHPGFSGPPLCNGSLPELEATSTLFPDHVLHYDGFTYLLAQGG